MRVALFCMVVGLLALAMTGAGSAARSRPTLILTPSVIALNGTMTASGCGYPATIELDWRQVDGFGGGGNILDTTDGCFSVSMIGFNHVGVWQFWTQRIGNSEKNYATAFLTVSN